MINQKLAEKFRKLAAGMEKQIDAKMNPATAGRTLTRRRAQIIDSMRRDGERLKRQHSALLAIADLAENGTLPESLAKISSRNQIEILTFRHEYPLGRWGVPVEWGPLGKMGISNDEAFQQAKADLRALIDRPETPEERNLKEIRKLETELRLRKEPGFFVTPDAVVKMMLEYAEIGPEHTVLEPSAGIGNIADKLPKNNLKVIEWNSARRRFLELKGFAVVGDDFLEHHDCYDRIIQNPPFEGSQDIDHVRHAYGLLNPGGILVSVMGTGPFFRGDKKAMAFRDWFYDEVSGDFENLPEGAFKSSGTGVSARLVVIRKPFEERRAA